MEAFGELYRHYLPRIHRFAWRRTGSVQVAEDVCAATFESAFRRLDDFQWRSGGFAPWLFRIATNEITDHYRREARPTTERGQRAMATMHQATTADPASELPDDHEELRRALDALNPRYQRAIALRYLADMDQAEAARAMGMTKPAFAVVLSRALKAMRKQIDRTAPTVGPAEEVT